MLLDEASKGLPAIANTALTVPVFRRLLLAVFPAAEHRSLRGILVGIAPGDWRSLALALLSSAWAQQQHKRFAAVWVPDRPDLDTQSPWIHQLRQLGLSVDISTFGTQDEQPSSQTTTTSQGARHYAVQTHEDTRCRPEQRYRWASEHSPAGHGIAPSSWPSTTTLGDQTEGMLAQPNATAYHHRAHRRKLSRSVLTETRFRRLRLLCAEALQRDLDLVALGHCLDDEISILVHRIQHGGFLDGLSALAPASAPNDSPLQLPRVLRPFWQIPLAPLQETCRVALMKVAREPLMLSPCSTSLPQPVPALHPKDTRKPMERDSFERDVPKDSNLLRDSSGACRASTFPSGDRHQSTGSGWKPIVTSLVPPTTSAYTAAAPRTERERTDSQAMAASRSSKHAEAPRCAEQLQQLEMEPAECPTAGPSPQISAALDGQALVDSQLYLAPVLKVLRQHEDLLDEEADQVLRKSIEFSSPLGYVVLRPANLTKHALTKEVGLRALLRILQYVGGLARTSRTEALERLYEDITAPATSLSGRTLMGCLLKPQNSLNRIGAFLHQVRWRRARDKSADPLNALQADQEFYLKQAAEVLRPADREQPFGRASRQVTARETPCVDAGKGPDAKSQLYQAQARDHLDAGNVGDQPGRSGTSRSRDLEQPQHQQQRTTQRLSTAADPKIGWYPRFIICREPASNTGRPSAWIPVNQSVLWDRRFLLRIETQPDATSSPVPSTTHQAVSNPTRGLEAKHRGQLLNQQSAEQLVKEALCRGTHQNGVPRQQSSLVGSASMSLAQAPPPMEERGKSWFRVRQMTLHDWTRLTAWRSQLKWTFVPYVCRLGLPVFDDAHGLVAMPHFGYNSRPDLRFTVLFTPVNRTLPPDLDRSVLPTSLEEYFAPADEPEHS
jgi:hypothetical protein